MLDRVEGVEASIAISIIQESKEAERYSKWIKELEGQAGIYQLLSFRKPEEAWGTHRTRDALLYVIPKMVTQLAAITNSSLLSLKYYLNEHYSKEVRKALGPRAAWDEQRGQGYQLEDWPRNTVNIKHSGTNNDDAVVLDAYVDNFVTTKLGRLNKSALFPMFVLEVLDFFVCMLGTEKMIMMQAQYSTLDEFALLRLTHGLSQLEFASRSH